MTETLYYRHTVMDKKGAQRPVTTPISMSETLTLRDQFAMVALTGIVANPDYDLYNGDKARVAYEIADAMLKERKKKK